MTAIQRLLIANRGEIALRVMLTCRRLGIDTVAIHTDDDAFAPHVARAGRAVRVPSYLEVEAVVAAAVEAGADAVHPGYGFLSERAEFARAVAAAGLTFVGPTPEAIEQLGRKDAAREIAVAAGVPVVPSYDVTGDPATFDYPVLVKAAAGGGGKGMRIVRSAGELAEALGAAAREAGKAFGDEALLIEKYVERGRHIEVQIFGDTHGNLVHLFERDCSVQRRHQKVVEEAPAPTISDDQRRLVHQAAVALARQVGYVNAGTVEFLLDTDSGRPYLLEMNTRLQVEHPVTELITGQDLVEWQLRVAQGESLPVTQEELRATGHAIEARIYAEDPWGGFLPQAGVATYVEWPDGGRRHTQHLDDGDHRLRVDHALATGQEVSSRFDPMLGKVIVWAPDRDQARELLVRALDDTVILGLTTNTGFARALVAGEAFAHATIDTAWLDRGGVDSFDPDPHALGRVLVAAQLADRARRAGRAAWTSDGWRLGEPPAPMVIALDREVVITGDLWAGTATVDGTPARRDPGRDWVGHARDRRDQPRALVLGGHLIEGRIWERRGGYEVVCQGQRSYFEPPDAFADHGPEAGDSQIQAPMPGAVLTVAAAVGDLVAEGQVLGTMEAMKMELALKAPYAGTVVEVAAAPGDQVALGAVLFVVHPEGHRP